MKKLTKITVACLFLVMATASVTEAALFRGNASGDNDWFKIANWNGPVVPGVAAGGTGASGQLGNFGNSDYAIIDGNAALYEELNMPGMSVQTQAGDGDETQRIDIINGARVNLTGGAMEFAMHAGGNASKVILNISGDSVLDANMSNTKFLQRQGNANTTGELNLGDATSGGTFRISHGGNSFGHQQGGPQPNAPMVIRGVGAVEAAGDANSTMAMFSIKFVADGWGGAAGRVLDLSSWAGNSRDEAGLDWGFYATNGAELKMFTVHRNTQYTGVGDKVWHEAHNADVDKINGFGVKNSGWPAAGVYVSGSVLALDHPDTPGLIDGIGAWKVSGVTMDNTTMSFRYDNNLAASLGVNETNLKVFMAGVDVTSSVDTANHIIYAEGLAAGDINSSTFAVALGIPEPSAIILLALSVVGLPIRRCRR